MSTYFVLLFALLTVFFSCNGQNITNAKRNKKLSLTHEIAAVVPKLGNNLWYVFQDKKNNYWFGSNGEGVFRYDGKTILNFTTKHGLCNDSIRQIKEDDYGNMYFSTLSGINKFDGAKMTTLQPIKSTEWKLESNDMWFFLLGKKGEQGPYRYDGEKLYNLEFPKHYLHDEITKSGINPFFSPYEIYSIYKDRQGAMWFGTSVFGACRYDGNSIKWMYEKDLTIAPNGGTFGIRSIFEDKTGQFWICNTAQRFQFDFEKTAKNDRLIYEKTIGIGNTKIFDGEKLVYYSHIVEDENEGIWLTTWDQGVFKYEQKKDNQKNDAITKYIVKDGKKPTNLISMYKDNNGDLWVGTFENGAFKFNGHTFEKFNP